MSAIIIAQPKELIGAFVNMKQGQPLRGPWGNFNALGLIRNDNLVAGVIYNDYSPTNAYIHIGAEDGCRWMTRDFLFAVFDYPFNQLGLRRLTGLVREHNKRAMRFDEHLGFVREGRLRDFFSDGDAIVYGMKRDECRFISRLEQRKAA